MHSGLDGGCSLSGAPLAGSLGTLIAMRQASDSADCADILSTSLFMVLIFFLLKPEWADLDAWNLQFAISECLSLSLG